MFKTNLFIKNNGFNCLLLTGLNSIITLLIRKNEIQLTSCSVCPIPMRKASCARNMTNMRLRWILLVLDWTFFGKNRTKKLTKIQHIHTTSPINVITWREIGSAGTYCKYRVKMMNNSTW